MSIKYLRSTLLGTKQALSVKLLTKTTNDKQSFTALKYSDMWLTLWLALQDTTEVYIPLITWKLEMVGKTKTCMGNNQ